MEHQNEATISGTNVTPAANRKLLILNCILLSIGNCGGPLITRLYFLHGGHRIWLRGFIETAGFPFITFILILLYFHRRIIIARNIPNPTATLIHMRGRLFIAVSVIGVLTGLDNYLYSYGFAHLPISIYAVINSTRLVFMAIFAFFLVKQRFTSYSINAVVLLTIASVLLAFRASNERPKGETNGEFVMGFLMTVAAAALYGLVSPLFELMYKKAKQEITYTLVLEMQMVSCFVATLFCFVGMIIDHDFKVIPREALEFGLGKTKYYLTMIASVALWQCFFLGALGVIHYGSALLLGVLATLQIPVMEIFAVIFFNEKFDGVKGVSLVLSIWGFFSFFYGEYQSKKMRGTQATIELV